MPPPQHQQLPSDHATPRPIPRPPARESSVPVPAAKRAPPPPSAPAAAAKKMARPASAPDLTAAARPRPRPPSTPAKKGTSAAKSGTGRPPAAFMAPRGAQAVRPTRRLTPGTAVYVRTTFRPRNVNIRCRILLWLRARVVSSTDAYHYKVKYAADLSDMFAGKIACKHADHVRLAPPPTHSMAKEAKEAASSLQRR